MELEARLASCFFPRALGQPDQHRGTDVDSMTTTETWSGKGSYNTAGRVESPVDIVAGRKYKYSHPTLSRPASLVHTIRPYGWVILPSLNIYGPMLGSTYYR